MAKNEAEGLSFRPLYSTLPVFENISVYQTGEMPRLFLIIFKTVKNGFPLFIELYVPFHVVPSFSGLYPAETG